MNIFLWILQVLLSLHTIMGALWKFSNSEQTVPTLNVIPHSLWLALSILEIICAIMLILPALRKNLRSLVPKAALLIALEMIAFCIIHLNSGSTDYGPMIYWIVVALICGFIAYGRSKDKSL